MQQLLTPLDGPSRTTRLLAVAYALLIAYGSLYPFTGWRLPSGSPFAFLTGPWPRYITRSDIFINILVYLPLGLLTARVMRHRFGPRAGVLLAAFSCLLLSLAMESLQAFLPGRVSSRLDSLLNGLGGLAGALLLEFAESSRGPLRWLVWMRCRWFRPGRVVDLGLAAVGLWVLSHLSPLWPSLSADTLARDLRHFRRVLMDPSLFGPWQAAAHAFAVMGLGLMMTVLARSGKNVVPVFVAGIGVVLLLKVPVVGRELTLEQVSGALAGIAAVALLGRSRLPFRSLAAGWAILLGFLLGQMEPLPAMGAASFNWVPFRGMRNMAGLADILAGFWPFLALGCLAALATGPQQRRLVAAGGGVALVALLFPFEWARQAIPGQQADITDVILALTGWSMAWWWQPSRGAGFDGKGHHGG
jgi:VanZ family protein